ncbi:alpha/beta fold hydrolase [Aeromicrobium sp.]|uniref:alpha/beta fold hydrolase n=1 Tax=Aeromicrobium sp. TaxID=1871063 RepID=UPI003C4099EA
MSTASKLATTAGAFVAAGLAAKILNDRQTERRRLRRGENVPFGSVHSATRKVVSADGIRINVEIDEPDGENRLPTIVFVHGVICTLDSWHYQRIALRGRARMVFMDHRSHGGSDVADRASSTIDNLAADLFAVIEACTTGPVALVGHSMGGMTIMQLAADHPEMFGRQVVGVALISTSPRLPLVSNPALRRLVPVARRIGPVVDWGRGFNSFSVVRRWGLGPNAQERHVDMTNEMILHAPTRVLTDFHPMFAELDVRHALETLSHVPTIVIAGTHDSVTPLSHSRRIADDIAGSSLVILEDTGHMAMFEEHGRVTDLILELAEKVSA